MAEKENKPDVVLTNGREVRFDFTKVTVKEWRAMLSPTQTDEEGDSVLTKVSGVTKEEMEELTVEDQRILTQGMFRAYRNPLPFPG